MNRLSRYLLRGLTIVVAVVTLAVAIVVGLALMKWRDIDGIVFVLGVSTVAAICLGFWRLVERATRSRES